MVGGAGAPSAFFIGGVSRRFELAWQVVYKSTPMKKIACLLVFAFLAPPLPSHARAQSSAQAQEPTIATYTAGLEKKNGFLPYYWDGRRGQILFELSPEALHRQFLYYTALGSGIGSIHVFADRSSFGSSSLCRLERVGMRVLVIEENTRFRAVNGGAALEASVEQSFPTSVIAALPIEAEENGTVLVDANPLLVRDAFDLLSQLSRPSRVVGGEIVRSAAGAAPWHLDLSRSAIDLGHSGSFPRNTEMEALLTFESTAEGNYNQPDRHTISVREHHSFVELPSAGYQPREQDPRVGYFHVVFRDFARPYDREPMRYWIARWRLVKKDPNAALSEPVKPIVFYLDPAIPEPMRSAIRRGAMWWNQAFEQAGFKNALRVEDLPAGANPLDFRYPTIQWTNRSARGWSVGQSQVDPRTGEILHSVVQLDSHRMRTLNNYWESLVPAGSASQEEALDAFSALDNLDPQVSDRQIMLNRIALLACHEVGHALGLEHNFVASTFGRGSVMDYYAPRIRIRPDGSADLSDAYMQGTGSYDRFAIEWGYSEGKAGATPAAEKARLDAIVRGANAKGIVWGNYRDPRWNAYDDGPDPVTWLKEVLPVRDALVARYGPQFLRPGEPVSMLASRFPLIYMFHQYALAAAVNAIGSAEIPLSLAGDGLTPVIPWPSSSQKEALDLVLKALSPSELEIPSKLWKKLAPNGNLGSDPERFTSSAGYLFSPEDGARRVAEIVAGGLLDPERMERLAVLSQEQPGALSPEDVVSTMVRSAFSVSEETPAARDLGGVVQTEIAERLMILSVNPEATPEVQAAALTGVHQAQDAARGRMAQDPILARLNHEISLFLRDPQQNTPKLKSSGAPPGPPV
jgi:hypothetical protein